ncbi:MAG: single-stranded DNA-binding protein [Bacteroidia bacterium]|nr:single-stranded DNA-binding protein [Bacteroidia bacterium]
MNKLKNQIRLIGHLGKDPEIKEFNEGKKLAKTSIATSDSYTNKDGDKVEETQWHNLVAWGGIAEVFEKYLKKGSFIAVEGKLQQRSYEDKDGKTKYITEVNVQEMLMLDSKTKKAATTAV